MWPKSGSRLVEMQAPMAPNEGEGRFDLLPPGLREIGQIIRLPAAAAGLRPGPNEKTLVMDRHLLPASDDDKV